MCDNFGALDLYSTFWPGRQKFEVLFGAEALSSLSGQLLLASDKPEVCGESLAY